MTVDELTAAAPAGANVRVRPNTGTYPAPITPADRPTLAITTDRTGGIVTFRWIPAPAGAR